MRYTGPPNNNGSRRTMSNRRELGHGRIGKNTDRSWKDVVQNSNPRKLIVSDMANTSCVGVDSGARVSSHVGQPSSGSLRSKQDLQPLTIDKPLNPSTEGKKKPIRDQPAEHKISAKGGVNLESLSWREIQDIFIQNGHVYVTLLNHKPFSPPHVENIVDAGRVDVEFLSWKLLMLYLSDKVQNLVNKNNIILDSTSTDKVSDSIDNDLTVLSKYLSIPPSCNPFDVLLNEKGVNNHNMSFDPEVPLVTESMLPSPFTSPSKRGRKPKSSKAQQEIVVVLSKDLAVPPSCNSFDALLNEKGVNNHNISFDPKVPLAIEAKLPIV
ncbi:hypothetical protein SUGI_0311890 [Cryptomeria japonica]|nr:hypothetical protein SUGI_0311890 [Cryptomeria japonica]